MVATPVRLRGPRPSEERWPVALSHPGGLDVVVLRGFIP